MKISLKPLVAISMAFFMSNIPHVAVAEEAQGQQMVSTSEVVDQLTREQSQQVVKNFLARSDVQSELVKRGLSPEEAQSRLASLSEQELKVLSHQMQKAYYGGDILVTILVVVLIIYLIKRI